MSAGIERYESRAAGGPMQTFSSAKRTCSASVSAVECTATDRRPKSLQARITRSAISPRLAISTLLNTVDSSGLFDTEERLPVLDVRPVLHQDVEHLALE